MRCVFHDRILLSDDSFRLKYIFVAVVSLLYHILSTCQDKLTDKIKINFVRNFSFTNLYPYDRIKGSGKPFIIWEELCFDERTGNGIQHSEVFHPRRPGHSHHGFSEGLSAALQMVRQSRVPNCKGAGAIRCKKVHSVPEMRPNLPETGYFYVR
jgi:hypothetical protein